VRIAVQKTYTLICGNKIHDHNNTMKKIHLLAALILMSGSLFGQLRLREKMGGLAGNLMTGKTDDLSVTSPMVILTTGIYDPATNTSESNYFPKGTEDGSHIMSITFMKNEGTGMFKVSGDVKIDGQESDYVGLGSYGYVFDKPVTGDKTITVQTETGDKASYTLSPVPEIEIISINGDSLFPIVDLTEDMKIKVTNPKGSEGTVVKIGLLSMAAGAKIINYFAEYKATGKEILIPKESFSNLEISGALNTGQVDKGQTYLIVTREKVLQASEIDPKNISGTAVKPTFKSQAYGSKQVVVKGKQENGVITEVKFSGKYKDNLAYSVYKPNARAGIPFSRASKFGLASLSISGRTYKKETEKGSSTSYGIGTSYTTTWTRTTTYKFPQLPEQYWEGVMDAFYKKFTASMKQSLSIDFANVDEVTAASNYKNLFQGNEYNNEKGVSKSYRNTLFTTPNSFAELWANRSSSKSEESATNMMMKELGLDGLVSIQITFDVGANENNEIVLLPQVHFSMKGMDETNQNKPGTYADGFITFKKGVPFSEEKLKNDPNYLIGILNIDSMVETIKFMLLNLKQKEVTLGFDKIWSIGEE